MAKFEVTAPINLDGRPLAIGAKVPLQKLGPFLPDLRGSLKPLDPEAEAALKAIDTAWEKKQAKAKEFWDGVEKAKAKVAEDDIEDPVSPGAQPGAEA